MNWQLEPIESPSHGQSDTRADSWQIVGPPLSAQPAPLSITPMQVMTVGAAWGSAWGCGGDEGAEILFQ